MPTKQKTEVWRIQYFLGDTRLGILGNCESEQEAHDLIISFKKGDPLNTEDYTFRIVHFTKL